MNLFPFQNRYQSFPMDTCLWKLLLFYYFFMKTFSFIYGSEMGIYPAIGCISLCKTHDLHISRAIQHFVFHSCILREYRDVTWATFSLAWKFVRDDIISRCFLIFHLFKGFINQRAGGFLSVALSGYNGGENVESTITTSISIMTGKWSFQ